jgi:hypothetical protein
MTAGLLADETAAGAPERRPDPIEVVEAQRIVAEAVPKILTGMADPDLLLRLLLNQLARDGFGLPPTAGLRGFARGLQKAIEGTGR